MGNLQKTNLNEPPFYDDYDAAKNYYRVLFRPNRTVQTRELTTLQTMLQEQIARVGRHLFQEGSIVIPGGINASTEQEYIAVSVFGDLDLNQFDSEIGDLYIKSGGTAIGVEAKLLVANPKVDNSPVYLGIEYMDAEPGTGRSRFNDGESVLLVRRQESGDTLLATMEINRTGTGILVTVADGVYFVRGTLVSVSAHSILASVDEPAPILRVGFRVSENIITEVEDPTLLSNANGYPNAKAPGAARLQFILTLESRFETTDSPEFVELVRFRNGILQRRVEGTNYAVIYEALKQRTYETNGDFVVTDYPLTIMDHIRDENHPNGVNPPAQGGDESKFVARLGQGVSYVMGARSEINGFEDVVGEKARDTAIDTHVNMYANYGSYITINNVVGMPPVDIQKRFTFLQDDNTTLVGSFRMRSFKREDGTYRMYIFDLIFESGKTFANAKKVRYSDSDTLFTGEMVGDSLFESTKDSSVFRLPYQAIKTMAGNNGQNTEYSVVRSIDVQLNAQGVGSVSLVSTELFNGIDTFNYAVALTGASSGGTTFVPTQVLSLAGSPIGRTLNVNVGATHAGKKVRVIASVLKINPIPRVKTLKTHTMVLNFDVANRIKLPHTDIQEIVSVINDLNNLEEKQAFGFFDGQRPNWYENGEVYVLSGRNLRQTYTITYRYYEHSVGDYFNIDSYGGINRTDIPKTRETADRNQVSLAECMDFRQTRDINGNFASTGDNIDPASNIRYDVTYYLPRIDGVYVDASGGYRWLKGTPSLNGVIPRAPINSMMLFTLVVPAYTEDINKIMVSRVDNRRYTMRDIGKLDKRIGALEYYTTLNMLEQQTKNTQVRDPVTGNDRFKNGFFAEGFTDSARSDIADADWSANIDLDTQTARPAFRKTVTDLIYNGGTNNNKVGDIATMQYTHRLISEQPYATSTNNINPYAVFTWTGRVELTPNSDYWIDTIFSPPINTYATVYTFDNGTTSQVITSSTPPKVTNGEWVGESSEREGNWVFETMGSTTIESSSVRQEISTLSTAPVEFMRSIPVRVKLQNFRPYGRLHFIFGGFNVDNFVTPLNGNLGEPVMADERGSANAVLTIPNTDTLKYKTGEVLLRVSDLPNGAISAESLTSGETTYTAGGELHTQRVNNINEMKIRYRSTVFAWPYDPIAQTFFITDTTGVYLSKVDIFFAEKATNIPVTLEIRKNIVGMPSNEILIFGTKTLYPDEIVTSADGSAATSFIFDVPPYLEANTEYSVVLVADTQEYTVYKSVLGENIIGTNQQAVKQPHMGVFLTSANAMTWTPHQLEDLKLRIYAAQFATQGNAGGTSITMTKSGAPSEIRAPINCLYSATDSATVTITLPSHGLRPGDRFTISGVGAGNGFTDIQLNREHVVTATLDLDTFTITMPSNSTSEGVFGGVNIMAKTNMPISEFRMEANSALGKGTTTIWEYRFLRQASRSVSPWIQFTPGLNMVVLPEEGVLLKEGDFEIRCTMQTQESSMTPMFDLNGGAITFLHRRIRDDETKPSLFSYVSRSVKYDNPNTALRCWVGANLPGSNRMKVQVKLMTTGDQNLNSVAWTDMVPTKPVVNDTSAVQEFEYHLESTVPFVGIKHRVLFYGNDSTTYPVVADVRSVALA